MNAWKRLAANQRSNSPPLTGSWAHFIVKRRAAASQWPRVQMLFYILLTPILFGCDGASTPQAPVPPVGESPPPPPSPESPPPLSFSTAGHGHFRGVASVDQHSYVVEALLTIDGAVRIALWGPGDTTHVLGGGGLLGDIVLNPEQSSQFVGSIDTMQGDQGFGHGILIGQNCSPPDPGRFCTEPAPAEISMTILPGRHLSGRRGRTLSGTIQVTTNDGEEAWLIDVQAHSLYYYFQVRAGDPGDQYREELAPFAQSSDVIITIDGVRQLFFQSADSGCTAIGNLAPHLEGKPYVFDVTLSIENCNASYAFLNGEFEGLATETQDGSWSYDSWLLIFLSTPEESASRAALTMYAARIG